MILVTGAAGKTGQAVVRALVSKDQPVRALVHRQEQGQVLAGLGVKQVIVGDMHDQMDMDGAARGAQAVYHICPNVSPDEESIGQIAIAAAQRAGTERFVYHSVLRPQVKAMPHHWLKMKVEERLFESGLGCTILQPAAYMQNILVHWGRIIREGVYPVPYGVDSLLSMVDLEDIAEAAATVLTEPGHVGATYELVGPDVLTQSQVAAELGRQLGREVRAQVVPLEEWEQQARAAGMGEYQVNTLVKMFQYYDRHGFWGNSKVLAWLLGRPPTSFAAFVERENEPRT